MDSRSLTQSLAVDLYIYFYQLRDEGSMMTLKVVINLIQGKGILGTLSNIA